MFNIPKWKSSFIIAICLLSIYLAIPSLIPGFAEYNLSKVFPNNKVNLGLDLRGGAYLLLEVGVDTYFREQNQNYVDKIKSELNAANIKISDVKLNGKTISIYGNDQNKETEIEKIIKERIAADASLNKDGDSLSIFIPDDKVKVMEKNLMNQTLEITRRRIDESGTKEIDLQIQGGRYILLQVPGVSDPEEIKRLLGKTAKLSFHLVDDNLNLNTLNFSNIPLGIKLFPFDEQQLEGGRRLIAVQSKPVITGEMLINATVAVDSLSGQPVVSFTLNSIGGKLFADVSSKNIGKRLAIVLDNKVISAPTLQTAILGGAGQISGRFSIESANELALLLRAGALPAPIHVAEERIVGPSLGADSIQAGINAVVAGVFLVVLFMYSFYGMFGMVANIALVINMFMTIAILSLFGATLTLPGIAGMVLTLGMAVDANVLIFERIKEEIRRGKTSLASLEAGYRLAFSTILDANVTTVITAIVLYIFGTGAIRGFAVTLIIGIICSMFTAISLTKVIIGTWYYTKKPKILPINAI